MYDILIKNIDIADGTGAPLFKGSVGVRDGRIKDVFRSPDEDSLCTAAESDGTKRVIEGKPGWILCPGFFDTHNHNDLYPFVDRFETATLLQGVTTQIVGNCGQSPAPVSADPERFQMLLDYIQPIVPYRIDNELWRSWITTEKYLNDIKALSPVIHREQLAGHGTIRLAVMKMENRKPTSGEAEQMKNLLREAMEAGAIGLSSGLIYPPGVYSDREELIDLCKVLTEYDGVYTTHMRNESDLVIGAVKEAIDIGRQSGCKVLISHLKSIGPKGRENAEEILRLIETAQDEGIRVINDQYQSNLSSTGLAVLFPPFSLKDGIAECVHRLSEPDFRALVRKSIETDLSWENYYRKIGPEKLTVIYAEETNEYAGLSIADIAVRRDMNEVETIMDLLVQNHGNALLTLEFCGEELVERIFASPFTAIGCDGIGTGSGLPAHPRGYSNHVYMLGEYVRNRQLVSWEEAIRKCTSLPADFLGLKDRGHIRADSRADLVIFDRETVGSKASFKDPFRKPEGICHVIIDGIERVNVGEVLI